MSGTDRKIVGIDYLRAIFSVAVVAVHLGYVFPSAIFDEQAYTTHAFGWSDFVNFYVLCLAVPVFILISTYLYSLKPTDTGALLRRLGRIVRLLVFWSLAYQIFFFTGYGFLKQTPRDPEGLAVFLLTAGNTVYYFFIALAVVTVVTHYAKRWPSGVVWGLFVITTVLVGVLPVAHRALGPEDQTTAVRFLDLHANPLNFLPLAFAGVGLARLTRAEANATLGRLALGAVVLAGASAVLDWTYYVDPLFFTVNQFAIPAYTRPSLIFLAVAVLTLAIRWRGGGNRVIGFMARHSLAVYCLHPFFVPVKYKMKDVLHLTGVAEVVLPLVVVLALSYAASLVLPWFLRDEVIR
ncbi:MAG TPA: acyltransferase [Gemmataceae bacterium]|nr:acyltransferase [Gemmataceae bacterium]